MFEVRLGITGLAQMMGLGLLRPRKLAVTDMIFIRNSSVCIYLRLLIVTLLGKGQDEPMRNASWRAPPMVKS